MSLLTLEILQNNRETMLKIISRAYPISVDLLEKYKDCWHWEGIAINKHICWTNQLTEQYQSKLFAKKLPHNAAITWSVSLIEELISQQKITWEDLMWQDGIFETPQTTALCLSQWSKGGEHMQPQFGNDKYDLLNYRYIQFGRWGKDSSLWAAQTVENIPNLKWDLFSGVQGFPWTLEFIEQHEQKLDWDILSRNSKIPWTFEFIEKHRDKLNWENLSYNRGVTWNIHFLTKFAERIHWNLLLNILLDKNFSLPENLKLHEIVKTFPEKIEWAYPNISDGYWEGTLSGIFDREEIYWTPELFYKVQPHIEAFFQQLHSTVFDSGDDDVPSWSIPKIDAHGNPVYWTYFAETNNWSSEFFDLMLSKQTEERIITINWEHICASAKHLWTSEFVAKHKTSIYQYMAKGRYIGWTLGANPHFPWKDYFVEFLPYFTERCFREISANPNLPLSIEFLQQYEQKLEWGFNGIETRSDLTEEIITHYKDKLDWDVICRKGDVPIKILKKFHEQVHWSLISRRNDLKMEDIDLNLPWNWERVFQNNHINIADCMTENLVVEFLENR